MTTKYGKYYLELEWLTFDQYKKYYSRNEKTMTNGWQVSVKFPKIKPSSQLDHIHLTSITTELLGIKAEKHWSPEWKHLDGWHKHKLVPNPNFLEIANLMQSVVETGHNLDCLTDIKQNININQNLDVLIKERGKQKDDKCSENLQLLWDIVDFIDRYLHATGQKLLSNKINIMIPDRECLEHSHRYSWCQTPDIRLMITPDELISYLATRIITKSLN